MQQDTLEQQAAATIARGSKSFAAAARLFRPAMRRDVMLLYTWCRHCDDVTDGQQFGHGQHPPADRARLEALRRDSLDAAGGTPGPTLPYRALAEVCRRHEIEPALIEDHLKGFELDVEGWKPRSIADTLEYCYYVAGAVGVMMARIMGVRDRPTLLRACDLGMGFQLTNIARDVVEDARAGRCYLPLEWLESGQLRIGDLARPKHHPRVFGWVEQLLARAEPYYDSAAIGVRALPPRAGWAVATARAVYRDIGRSIIAGGPPMLARRAHTSRTRKVWRIVTGAGQVAAGAMAGTETRARQPGLWAPKHLE
ncbi:MAG: phytoene/squalene synthase family protein [Wenzhouxiangellaceae bacterium]|nr:phytoene/squalene synthase family protein [Wenzhouxiangellaceae bacterium]